MKNIVFCIGDLTELHQSGRQVIYPTEKAAMKMRNHPELPILALYICNQDQSGTTRVFLPTRDGKVKLFTNQNANGKSQLYGVMFLSRIFSDAMSQCYDNTITGTYYVKALSKKELRNERIKPLL